MTQAQNWRPEIDALDYFGNQKKKLEVADRRPVIRRASDLVGPGIGAAAVRIDDYSDVLATFNGYYAAGPGAGNAPNEDDTFVGYTISDAEFGGRQVFTSLETGLDYTRTFVRSPVDPEAVSWSQWYSQPRVAPSAQGYSEVDLSVLSSTATVLTVPGLTLLGDAGYYEVVDNTIKIRKPGVYTGTIQIGDRTGDTEATIAVYRPNGTTTVPMTQLSTPLAPTVHIPFTCWATDGNQGFYVVVQHAESGARNLWYRFSCTRVGEAV